MIAAHLAIVGPEQVGIEPGSVQRDLALVDPQRGHVIGQPLRYRQQPLRGLARRQHLLCGRRVLAPMVDVRTARLDADRQAQCLADLNRSGTVGVKELRIDQIERGFGMEPLGQRQDGACFGTSV